MKFSKYLESQSVPEWRKAYIYYKGLKKKLKQVERVTMTTKALLHHFINLLLFYLVSQVKRKKSSRLHRSILSKHRPDTISQARTRDMQLAFFYILL